MAAREKPSARSVPISLVRDATLAYIVIIAPMIAPIEKMTEIVVPRYEMNFDERFGLVGVELRLALGLERQALVALDVALDRVEAVAVGQPEDQRRRTPIRRNACSICSASPQISESKPVRPASNTPTTVQSRGAKRSVSPMAGAAKARRRSRVPR